MTSTKTSAFGIFRATSLVVGNMVGTSIFLLPSVLSAYGSISLIGWLITASGAIFLALTFASLSRRFPQSGGPYIYSRHVFGDFVGFQMAWTYWIANWVSNAAVAIAFVNFLSYFWTPLVTTPVYSFLLSVTTLWILTAINALSLRQVGNIQVLTTALKLFPLIIIIIFGIFNVDKTNFFPLVTDSESISFTIQQAAALTLFSFMGLESATIPAEQVQNPKKIIPRATVWGTLIAAFIYIASNFVVFGVIPSNKLIGACSPFSQVGEILFGSWAGPIIAIAAIFSCFGTLNGWILIQGQIPMAAARDGLFPASFAKVSKKGIPVFGLVFSSVLITFLLAMNYEMGLVEQFKFILNLTTFAILMPYLYSSAAELLILVQENKKNQNTKFSKAMIIPIIGIIYAMWTITGAGTEIVFLGSLFLFSSLPVYIWMKANQSLK